MAVIETLLHPFATAKIVVWPATCSVRGRLIVAARSLYACGDATLCAPWSSAGVPSITVPTGLDEAGLPLALQLVQAPAGLARLLGVAAWCERVVAFAARPRE